MSDKKISQLTSGNPAGTDITLFAQGGSTLKCTLLELCNPAILEHVSQEDPHPQYEFKSNLGTAAYTAATDYATAAQGATADSALQASDVGSAAYAATTDFATAAQGAKADTAVQPGSLGTAAYTNSTAYDAAGTASSAISTHVGLDDPHTQYALESALGTAAYAATTDFATAAQGALASSALQPFGSQTAKYFYAAPNAADGSPTFRAILASDIPTLNQNTTGSSASCTGNSATVTGFSPTSGKTLSVSNTLTLAGTDGSTLNIGTGGTLGTAAYTASSAYDAAGTASSAVSTHVGQSDPHTQYALESALGTAAYTASTEYATAAQGAKADTAVQPAALSAYAPINNPVFTGTVTLAADPTSALHAVTKQYADGLVAGLVDYRGGYDASGNTYPATGGSGTAGAVMKGDTWAVSVAGTLGGTAVSVGDWVMARVDAPGQTTGNWDVLETNIGYVPENVANKSTDINLGTSNTIYSTQGAVKSYVDTKDALRVPYTGATGDVNLGAYCLKTDCAQATSSAGFGIKNTSGQLVATFGPGGGQAVAFQDGASFIGTPSAPDWKINDNNANVGDVFNDLHINGIPESQKANFILNESSYSTSTRVLTLTKVSNWYYYVNGKRFDITADVVFTAHANTTGTYFYYFDSTGTATVSSTVWDIMTTAQVCFVQYNTANDGGAALGVPSDETHGMVMSSATHKYLHLRLGARTTGMGLSGYTVNTDTTAGVSYAIDSGTIIYEDNTLIIDALADGGPYEMCYFSAAGVPNFRSVSTIPLFVNSGTNNVQYNPVGSGLTDITTNNRYFNYYVLATNFIGQAYRKIIIPGNAIFTTAALAQAEFPNLQSLQVPEDVIVWRVTSQFGNAGGTNFSTTTGRTRINSVTAVGINSVALTGTLTDHQSLTNRSATNCHPASSISNTPAGTIAATDVQSAIDELDTEKAPIASPTFTGTVTGTFSGNLTGNVTGNVSGSSGSCTGNAATASAVAVGGITGLGTGVATALAIAVGSSGAFIVNGGALGTPSSGTLTNCTFPTLNQNTTGSAAKWTTARNLAGNSVDGSVNVAFSNKFIVQGTSDAGLSGAQFLGALGTGILKNTTSTGVLSIAIASDFPTLNQNTTGSAGSVTGLSVTTGKTLTVNNSLALSGTDASTLNIGTGGTLGTAAYTASTAYDAAGAATSAVSTHVGLADPHTQYALESALGTAAYTAATAYATAAQGTKADAALPSASFTDTAVTSKLITGFVSGAGVVAATDTILQALQKINGNVAASGSGTVTSVSVVSANGFAGTVATASTTPAITLTTTITGILKGNGTAISAASAGDFPTLNQNTTGSAGSVTGLSVTAGKTLSVSNSLTLAGTDASTLNIGTGGTLGTAAYTAATAYATSAQGTKADSAVQPGGALGTPSSGTLTNCTFPTLNQDTTGMAGSIKSSASTGKMTITGPTAASTRSKTVRDADDTILELGGSYTPTGTWVWTSASVTWPTFNQNTTGSATKWTTARTLAGNSVDGSANVAFSNKFIVQGTADAGLSGAQFLGALGTGILKNTTTTGVLSIAVAGDFPTLNQNTSGSAATLGTARAIYGNNFDGSAALTQVIASTYGGTGNGFTKFSGATTSEKTYTLPDASCSIMTGNGIAKGGVLTGTGAGTFGITTVGADGTVLMADTASAGGVKWGTVSGGGGLLIAVRAATTANITISTDLNNGDTLDGLTLADGDLVLVKDQTTESENGIYVVGSSPQRYTSYDSSAEIVGSVVYVTSGTENAGARINCEATGVITVGSDAIRYTPKWDAEVYVGGISNGTTIIGANTVSNINATDGWNTDSLKTYTPTSTQAYILFRCKPGEIGWGAARYIEIEGDILLKYNNQGTTIALGFGTTGDTFYNPNSVENMIILRGGASDQFSLVSKLNGNPGSGGQTTITDNTWYRVKIRVRRSQSQAQLFLNGIYRGQITTNLPTSGTAAYYIGFGHQWTGSNIKTSGCKFRYQI